MVGDNGLLEDLGLDIGELDLSDSKVVTGGYVMQEFEQLVGGKFLLDPSVLTGEDLVFGTR